MKSTLIIGLMFVGNSLIGQIPGKPIEGPIVLFDTLTVKQGDIIYIGQGSDPGTGNFIHLYTPKNKSANTLYNIFSNNSDLGQKLIPQSNLDKGFAGKQLAVASFSKVSSKKKGDEILGVINMKEYQFIEGIFFNNVVVDFEQAIRSGEIIKISAPEITAKARSVELLFVPFEMTESGIEPVIVTIHNLNKKELYNKALNWSNAHYEASNQKNITKLPDVKIMINDFAKNVKFSRIMGNDILVELPYLFAVDFADNKIRMTFTLGDENGDIKNENGEVVANTSPAHMFNKNGEVLKMSQMFKVEAEKIMNDLSYALVNYLMT